MKDTTKRIWLEPLLSAILIAALASVFMGWISFGWWPITVFILTYLREDFIADFIVRAGSPVYFSLSFIIIVFCLFKGNISSSLFVFSLIVLVVLGVSSALISKYRRDKNAH